LSLRTDIADTRATLAAAWSRLPERLRAPTQFLGRQYAGCAATIGVMPRCDFACRGCYLGADANRARPLALAELKQQLRQIRAWLGWGGNVQLTDGEVTLRREADVIELVRYARTLGLVPMLMTHGETFRRRPGLLTRLVRSGGLSEVCFHVDTTMRGRRDGYARAVTEQDLDGLRAEFADLVRHARQATGRRLEAASTVTVTRATLDAVPDIVRGFLRRADAFKMVSFQPLAAIGRTDRSLEGVAVEELWERIAKGAGDPQLLRGEGWMGHPACSRFVQGLVSRDGTRLVPLYRRDAPADMHLLGELLDRLGGQTFRTDGAGRALARAASVLARHGLFIGTRVLPHLVGRARRAGTIRPRYFCIVSHHFMSAAEIRTPLGQERIGACAFRVPIGGRLESMCAVNANGLRDGIYRGTRGPRAQPREEGGA
jgi:hypothetical protein